MTRRRRDRQRSRRVTRVTRARLARTEPLGQTVVIIGGSADVAALAAYIMSHTARTRATYDIDGGKQLVAG